MLNSFSRLRPLCLSGVCRLTTTTTTAKLVPGRLLSCQIPNSNYKSEFNTRRFVRPNSRPIHGTSSRWSNSIEISDMVDTMKGLYNSNNLQASQQADRIIREMVEQEEPISLEVLYWAIECWSRPKQKGAEEAMDKLYQELQRRYMESSSTLSTTHQEYIQTAMIRLLQAYNRISNAHRAEELLLEYAHDSQKHMLLFPTLDMCKIVLSTWSQSQSSRRGARAEKLLMLMETDASLPNPDMTCYTLVLSCWASSNKEQAPFHAEQLLRRMEHTGRFPPNTQSYTCVLNAWSRSLDPDAPDHAERLLYEMQETKCFPMDRLVYTAMITVWGRSCRQDSIQHAESYFQQVREMQAQYSTQGNVDNDDNDDDGDKSFSKSTLYKATVVEYTALIQAWANYVSMDLNASRRAVDRVEDLLEEMILQSAVDHSVKPNRMTFASVLRTIGAARRIPDRSDRAKAVLRKMSALSIKPNTYILNLVDKCATGPKKLNSKQQQQQQQQNQQPRRK